AGVQDDDPSLARPPAGRKRGANQGNGHSDEEALHGRLLWPSGSRLGQVEHPVGAPAEGGAILPATASDQARRGASCSPISSIERITSRCGMPAHWILTTKWFTPSAST